MPVRKRVDRRRGSEVKAWSGYMMSGCDFFDDLAAIGLTEDTAWPLAEATWHRIGQDIIDHIEEEHRGWYPPARPFWAEEEFGPPPSRGKRRR